MSHCELEEVTKHINDKISLIKRLLELRAVGMAHHIDFFHASNLFDIIEYFEWFTKSLLFVL